MIDEYDSLAEEGYTNGHYNEMVSSGLSFALKDNRNLEFAALTGILRIAKEGMFNGLNNVTVYSSNDKMVSKYFGFTLLKA